MKPDYKDELNIRQATIDDIPIIQQVAWNTWPHTFSEILSPAQIEYMLEMMYSDKALNEQLEKENLHYFLAQNNNHYIGYLSVEHNCENSGKTKIHKAYILPDRQRMGLGRKFFDFAFKQAAIYGDTAIYLNVQKHNHKAIAFYEKYGMKNVKSLVNDIGNGFVMDDFIFEKVIS